MNIYQIIRLIIISIIISQVQSKCNPSTTENGFGNNQVKTEIRLALTNAVMPLTTTLFPIGSCKTFNRSSHQYGWENFVDGLLVPYTIELSDVKEIKIYSSKSDVIAFTVLYTNGPSLDIGDTSNYHIIKSNVINFENKDLIAIIIRAYKNIYSLRFLLTDQIDGTLKWTNNSGSFYGTPYLVDFQNEIGLSFASDFKITKIYGMADKSFIKTLKVDYTFNICNPYRTEPTFTFPQAPTTTAIQITTFKTTTTIPFIVYGTCIDFNGISQSFGKTDLSSYFFAKQFNFSFSDLNRITFYTYGYIKGITFYAKNGENTTIGNVLNEKYATAINLENKIINSLRITAAGTVNLLQFLIHDLSSHKNSWTSVPAVIREGSNYAVDANNNAPFSSNFQITWISGTAAPFFGISKLKFGYSYTQCNPHVPLPVPSASMTTDLFFATSHGLIYE